MEQIRFAVVGCGEIGIQTAAGIATAPHAVISVAMDSNHSLADDLARRYGGRVANNYDEVLVSPDVDTVYIATPHFLHLPMAIAAAQAGKHVLLEKPIAINVRDAKRIIHECELSGVRLGIAYHAQVDAVSQRVRKLIADGAIGRIAGIRYAALADKPESYWHGGYSGRAASDWRVYKEKAGGGILIMNLIHNFNTLRFVTGLEVVRAYGAYGTYATPVEVEDLVFATLHYDNGAIGAIEAGSAIRGGAAGADDDRIYGTRGQVVIGSERARIYSLDGAEGIPASEWTEIRVEQPPTRQRMVEGFALALLDGRTPPVTGYDGLKALEIVEAVYRSRDTGAPVALPLE